MAYQFPVSPTEGQIVTPSSGRSMVFTEGRWRLHKNTIPVTAGAKNMLNPPIESETPPALPNSNPFWFKMSTQTLHYQYNDGDSSQWIEV